MLLTRPSMLLGVFLLMTMTAIVASAEENKSEPSAPRQPIALQLVEGNQRLLIANRGTGTVSVMDPVGDPGKVLDEVAVGKQLSAMVPWDDDRMLATDEAAHQLVVLKYQAGKVTVESRLDVGPYPVSVVTDRGRNRCYVTSLWSRRLTEIAFDGKAAPQVKRTLDLGFAPRSMCLGPKQQKLIVADSFGGQLALIDLSSLKLLSVRAFPGHNIRGMALGSNGRMLVVAHQMLNELAHTVRNDVHWGLLMSNDLRWLKIESVLDPDSDLVAGGHMHPLGQAGDATGDPSGIAIAPDGKVVVALGGVGQVALGREQDFRLLRVYVGQRPTGIVIDGAAQRAYVANTFSDSVSVIDLEQDATAREISLGASREPTLAERGERLFYDARLSHDGWMSCHSCHTDGHSNGLLNDNFSDKSFGAPKRVLSLLGRAGTDPFAWNGGAKDLEQQIHRSIENTMQGDQPPTRRQIQALAAYVRTLQSPPSIDRLRKTEDAAAIQRGQAIFAARDCNRCHAPPAYTTPKTYDVGLEDSLGQRRFNPPSLRGVGQRGPYFHDNRAKELHEVFSQHGHQIRQPLEGRDLRDLLAFLRSL